jgi:hypothetical protein
MTEEHVKLDLGHYNELFLMQKEFDRMKTELESLKKKNQEEAYDFLLKFIMELRKEADSHGLFGLLNRAATKAGYCIIFEAHGNKSNLGDGEKVININTRV